MPALAPPAGHALPALLWLSARFVADEDANAGQRLGDLLDAEDLHGAVDHGLGDLVMSDEITPARRTASTGRPGALDRQHTVMHRRERCATMGSMAERYEYKVLELREKMIGGKMSGDKLEKVLNQHAGEGWRLKAITSADVKGRVGPGSTEGLLVTFERVIR
jgi:Domain of unknown function (DUF4177)